MKKIILILSVLFFAFVIRSEAQYVNIPDSNFRKFLITKYPSCFNSAKQMDTNCTSVVNEFKLNLDSLDISDLTGIKYFKFLQYLACNHNNLTVIPELPAYLQAIDFGYNQLTNFPQIQFSNSSTTLNFIGLSHNSITNIPNLKTSNIKVLFVDSNGILSLPVLPDLLHTLNCRGNNLTELPLLPAQLNSVIANNNNIYCLPSLPAYLTVLDVDTSKIKCLPNLPIGLKVYCTNNDSILVANNLPTVTVSVCSPLSNINNCKAFPQIIGRAFYDNNLNFVKDSGENYCAGMKVRTSSDNYTYTNTNGIFQLVTDTIGSHTLVITSPAFYTVVPSTINLNFSSYDTTVNLADIALQPNTLKDSLSIVTTPINWAARPGFKYAYAIYYANAGTTVLSPNLSFNYDNSLLTYDSSSNSAVANNGSSLNLSLGNLMPGQNGSFVAYFRVKTTASLGTSLSCNATLNASSCTATDSVTTAIRGSYDPNDKHATPQLTVQNVTDGNYIQYTIRFQNTGTDTAHDVTITDTLSSYLDPNQIQVVSYSHLNSFTNNGNVIFSSFNEINLPDSGVDKSGSCGYITFNVKPISPIAAGTIIPNKAYIYFDYNKGVKTNTAVTIIVNPVPLKLLSFTATPQEIEKVLVEWKTENEINTKYFVVEQSEDARIFKPVAEVAAKGFGGNHYFYSINKSNAIYLRLKMVDKDGAVTYSNIIKLAEQKANGIEIVNNPAINYLNIKSFSANNIKATIVNTQGFVVKTIILKQGLQVVDIANLPAGVYYLQSEIGSKKIVVEK